MGRERSAFGQRLFDARRAAGLTQQQVCTKLGISQGTLSELEKGAASSGYTAMLATLYGVDPYWLATGEGSRAGGDNRNSAPARRIPAVASINPLAVAGSVAALLAGYDAATRNAAAELIGALVRNPDLLPHVGVRLAGLLGVEAVPGVLIVTPNYIGGDRRRQPHPVPDDRRGHAANESRPAPLGGPAGEKRSA